MSLAPRNTSNTSRSRTACPLSDLSTEYTDFTDSKRLLRSEDDPRLAVFGSVRYSLICEICVICGCVSSDREKREQPRANSMAMGNWRRHRHDAHSAVPANIFCAQSRPSME